MGAHKGFTPQEVCLIKKKKPCYLPPVQTTQFRSESQVAFLKMKYYKSFYPAFSVQIYTDFKIAHPTTSQTHTPPHPQKQINIWIKALAFNASGLNLKLCYWIVEVSGYSCDKSYL